jgi:glutathione S-transferase
MRLFYIQGSPFARMARVLLREYAILHDEQEIKEFPPSQDFFQINPLGQVPVLDDGAICYFPTRIVLARIVAEAQHKKPRSAALALKLFRSETQWEDERLLSVILAMGDMLAVSKYQQWAGLGPVNRNTLGFNPAERNMERVLRTLDWLEKQSGKEGFWPAEISIQDVVLACLILWSEARGAIEWRGRPKLENIVRRLETRPSFTSTAPQPWPTNEN